MLIPLDRLLQHGFNPTGVIHLGGNVGEEQPIYDQLGVKKTIWIEAIKESADIISNKFKDRPDILVINAVISDKRETVPFYVTNNKASSSILEFGTHETSHTKVKIMHEELVTTTTLKDLNLTGYDTLNLDIQGAELKALKGADLTDIKWIYTEVNTEYVYKDCALLGEIDEYLKDFIRIDTRITRYGWGDALYKRKEKLLKMKEDEPIFR